jgi:hypothetical protein
MSLYGIAISGRGAIAQARRIETIAAKVAGMAKTQNGQRVGKNGQLGGWNGQLGGEDGQLVGLVKSGDVLSQTRGMDVLDGNGDGARGAVDPVLESAELIRALRALEANLQAIRIQDAVLERTVTEFARPVK